MRYCNLNWLKMGMCDIFALAVRNPVKFGENASKWRLYKLTPRASAQFCPMGNLALANCEPSRVWLGNVNHKIDPRFFHYSSTVSALLITGTILTEFYINFTAELWTVQVPLWIGPSEHRSDRFNSFALHRSIKTATDLPHFTLSAQFVQHSLFFFCSQ